MKTAGFAATEVVTQWDVIVGPDLASRSAPIRIAWPRRPSALEAAEPGTLHVRIEAGFALEAQHQSADIMERVNAFFGWRCVAAIRFTQVPAARRAAARPKPPPADETRLAAAINGLEDERLRRAMERFGRAVGRRETGQ